jgi:hypothetical protein
LKDGLPEVEGLVNLAHVTRWFFLQTGDPWLKTTLNLIENPRWNK